MNKKHVGESIAVAIALIFVAWMLFGNQVNNTVAPEIATSTDEVIVSDEGSISSIRIEPSTTDGNWIMYRHGAKLVISGNNLESVKVKAMPTGAGMGAEYPNGLVLGEAVHSSDAWIFSLPDSLMTTNLWAEGLDTEGNMVKSADLGNVGFKE
jgi:hypothetical protein